MSPIYKFGYPILLLAKTIGGTTNGRQANYEQKRAKTQSNFG